MKNAKTLKTVIRQNEEPNVKSEEPESTLDSSQKEPTTEIEIEPKIMNSSNSMTSSQSSVTIPYVPDNADEIAQKYAQSSSDDVESDTQVFDLSSLTFLNQR